MSIITHMLKVVWDTLREIFDESAYERYLAQHRVGSSTDAYAGFRREHELAKARRPRCC